MILFSYLVCFLSVVVITTRSLHAGEVAGLIPAGNSVKIFVECRGCQSDHRGCESSVNLIFLWDSVLFCSVVSFGISSAAELDSVFI
jgi:hypothetical protein